MSSNNDQGAAPDAASLHAAAVAYLARYSATRATLARALHRIVDRWQRETEAADAAASRRAVAEVVEKLAAGGVLNDAAFAEARARKLARTGHSRRATAAHLAARGVPADVAKGALAIDEDSELAAAVTYMRRRRLGPFRTGAAPPEAGRKDLGAMARAGFAGTTARQALALTAAEAEAVLAESRAAT
jgi:regulatory protein